MSKDIIKIAFVGHIDHGKSTLIGRLLFDTESLKPDKIKEIELKSKELGKDFEYSFVLDAFQEEQEKGKHPGGQRIEGVIPGFGHLGGLCLQSAKNQPVSVTFEPVPVFQLLGPHRHPVQDKRPVRAEVGADGDLRGLDPAALADDEALRLDRRTGAQ